nr:MAG TPA: hypothetical protein [Caudoviricetes sp.]
MCHLVHNANSIAFRRHLQLAQVIGINRGGWRGWGLCRTLHLAAECCTL